MFDTMNLQPAIHVRATFRGDCRSRDASRVELCAGVAFDLSAIDDERLRRILSAASAELRYRAGDVDERDDEPADVAKLRRAAERAARMAG